jgi:Cdc6-like AAA superfamily ATPase
MPSETERPAEPDYEGKALEIGRHFIPTTAINQKSLFCGRTNQIRLVVDAINQPGRHAILYGEPGVGKTSLANILATRITAGTTPIISPHINCDSGDSYESIWRKVFNEVQIISERQAAGFDQRRVKVALPLINQIDGPVTTDVVRRVLSDVGRSSVFYIILDEFDKIPDAKVRNLIADTIKVLSDRAVEATVILVGVADDVNGLIEDHQSVERCLSQVPMPRMSRAELEQILTTGLSAVGMVIEGDAANEITGLSKGLPHYAHLLALCAGRKALDSKTLTVTQRHVKDAIETAVIGTQHSIRTVYDKATYSTKKAIYEQVLLACAMSECDDVGRFLPVAVAEPLSAIMKRKYTVENFAKHLHAFCEPQRGPVLKKTGQEYRWRYRFVNPLMQPYVLMKGLADKLIGESELRLQFDSSGQGRIAFGDL